MSDLSMDGQSILSAEAPNASQGATSPSAAAHFTSSKGAKNFPALPVEAIAKLADNGVEQVALRIQRRNQRGMIATIPGTWLRTPSELMEVETWLGANWGGGLYRIEVRDATDTGAVPFFVFNSLIEGAPKVGPVVSHSAPAGMGAQQIGTTLGNGGAVQHPNMPAAGFLAGMSPQDRAMFLASAGGATHASDEIALQQLRKTELENDRFKRQLEEQARKQAEENRLLREQIAKAEEAAREARHAGELAALRAEIRASAAANAKPAQTGLETLVQMAPVITAMAPIVTAFVASGKDSTQQALASQQQLMTSVVAMATKPQPKDETLDKIIALAPLFIPVFKQMIEARGPEAQAKLFEALVDSQMNTVGMATNLLEQMAGPPESPTGQIIGQVIEGMKNIAQGYLASRGGLPGQLPGAPPVPQMPRPRAAGLEEPGYTSEDEPGDDGAEGPAEILRQAPPSAPAPATVPISAPFGRTPGVRAVDRAPQVIAAAPPAPTAEIIDAPAPAGTPTRRRREPKPPEPAVLALFEFVPEVLKTPAWRKVLWDLHTDPPSPAQTAATEIAGLLEQAIEDGSITDLLPRSSPEELPAELWAVMQQLPVTQTRPEYMQEVFEHLLTMLVEDNYLPASVLTEEASEEDAA